MTQAAVELLFLDLQVFRKMVEVVHHCQELGVMHRDLKPENFLLTSKVSRRPFGMVYRYQEIMGE